MELLRAAGFLIYRISGSKYEYLLLQASYPPFHWTPPKGHVDPGEDFLSAAVRETWEEANIKEEELHVHKDFEEDLFYEVKQSRYDEELMRKKQVKYWLARLQSNVEVKLSQEHQALKWASLKEAIDLVKFPDMEELLNKAEAFLNEKALNSEL